MNKIQINYFIQLIEFGGCEIHLLQLIKNIDQKLFETNLIFTTDKYFSKNIQPFIKEINSLLKSGKLRKVYHIKLDKGLRDVKAIIQIMKIMAYEKGIFHFYKGSIDACNVPVIIAALLKKDSLQTIQNRPAFPSKKNFVRSRFIRPFCLKATNLTIAVSEAVRQSCISSYKVPAEKILTIRNGIKLDFFSQLSKSTEEKKIELEKELKVNLHGKTIFLNVARLSEQKGHVYLIEALIQLRQDDPEMYNKILVFLVGTGPLEKKLKDIVKKNNLEESIKFLGFRTDVNELLLCADAFLLTSIYEGLPLTVVEAMTISKPVLATSVDGTPEIVIEEQTGLLINPEDPTSIKETIIKFLKIPSSKKLEMGQQGKQRVINEFNLDKQINTVQKIYKKLWQG